MAKEEKTKKEAAVTEKPAKAPKPAKEKPVKAEKPAKAPKPAKTSKKKERKQISRKKKIVIVCIAAVIIMAIVAALVLIYAFGITNKVFDSNVDSMEELAIHDANTISEFINESWDSLEKSADKLVMYGLDIKERTGKELDLQGCLEYLNMERANSGFDQMYIFTQVYGDTNVALYSDTFVQNLHDSRGSSTIPFIEKGYVDILNRTPERFVIKYLRDDTWVEDRTDALYYGVMLNNSIASNKLTVSGVEVVAVMARMDLTSIQDRIKIDCFDGRGYTSVIDGDGNYIASVYGVSALGKQDNYFTQIKDSVFDASSEIQDAQEVINSIKDGKSVRLIYTDSEGEKVATTTKIEGLDWTVIMTVDKGVFDDQSRDIILYTSYFTIAIIVAFLIIVILASLSSYTTVNTKAEVRARNDFLAIISHEIRTPLNAVVGFNNLARMNISNKDRCKEYLEKEGESSTYLLKLLDDILDLSEMKDHPVQLTEKAASIESIVYNVIANQRTEIQKKGLHFGAKKSLITPYIICDEKRVEQVMVNIMSNAVKFTDQGQIFMTIAQEKINDEKVKTTFKISDTGCGMSEEVKSKIFMGAEKSNTMQMKGTGLGMTITKMIIDAMGGTINVESELNKGTTFTISFVSKMCSNSEIYEYKKNMHVITNDDPTRKMHVFIVEDNELNAEILTEILLENNFKVSHAEDGAKAVEMFAASAFGEYDVVLMDIRMPVMDGFEATRAIRSLPREDAQNVPIFACTANAFKEDEDEAYASGMDDFLTKPIDMTQMLNKLQTIHTKRK